MSVARCCVPICNAAAPGPDSHSIVADGMHGFSFAAKAARTSRSRLPRLRHLHLHAEAEYVRNGFC